MSPPYAPLYKIGDFVGCDIEYISFIDYIWAEEDYIQWSVYYGIIISIDDTYHYYMDEYVYEVMCLDGEKRYFMESELKRM